MSVKKIVAVGGGSGNRTTLAGLRDQDCSLTAVVAMSDSGGSSGRLREELGQLPPGDLRQCLIALADASPQANIMRRLFDYRFSSGNGLAGHNFGNLLLTALTEITGTTISAIEGAAQLLGVQGQVLPVTLTNSTLVAYMDNGEKIYGESSIDLRRDSLDVAIDYIQLEPKAYAYQPALDAIEQADGIILGPGDIYTSVLPNLLVENVAEAIVASKALKIHVCNLATKPGESDRFKASTFVKTLLDYLRTNEPIDCLIYNNAPFPPGLAQRYAADHQYRVELDREECQRMTREIITRPMLASGVYLRHDSIALGRVILEAINRR